MKVDMTDELLRGNDYFQQNSFLSVITPLAAVGNAGGADQFLRNVGE